MSTPRALLDGIAARSVVDYSLARRAALHELRAGHLRQDDACDAQVYLRRAARHYGWPSEEICPVCAVEQLIVVLYAYGDGLPHGGNGRARARKELGELAAIVPEFTVYAVEVCLGCGWNYLVTSCVLGTGEPSAPRRSRTTGSHA